MSVAKHTSAALQHLLHAFTAIPFNRMLGLELEDITADQVTLHFKMKNELIGNFLQGILHGGVISAVLDMAGGMIVMAHAIEKHAHASTEELIALLSKCSTIDLQVSYLRPGKGTQFIAKAFLIKSGQTVSFTRMELHSDEGSLIASANATYLMR